MQIAVLVNPSAGRGRAIPMGLSAARLLRGRGHSVDILMGANRQQSIALARRAAVGGVDVVAACGGDGILQCALQSVAGTSAAIGLIPCGTGNDLARTLAIPVNQPELAAIVIDKGRTRTIDLCQVVGADGLSAPIATVVACGFDSSVADRAARIRVLGGRLRYQAAILAELTTFRPIPFRIVLDGAVHELPAMLVAVGNSPSYGGGMRICPAADLSDGLLNVTVIAAMSRRRLARVFPTVYSGGHLRFPEVLTFAGRAVRVEAENTSAYGDGDYLSRLPICCTATPAAVRVLVGGSAAL